MSIFDGFGIRSTAASVAIYGNVSACTSRHPPISLNPRRTLLNLPVNFLQTVSKPCLLVYMSIFDEFGIRSTVANVAIYGNVSACTSRHSPSHSFPIEHF